MGDFQGVVLGALLTLLGWDGTAFQNLKVDSDGHPQVDILSVADLSGALESVDTDGLVAYIAKFSGSWTALSLDSGSRLMVTVDVAALPADAATETSLQGVEDRIGALVTPASGSVNWRLDKILTQVTTPSLPADAATETSLQGIEDAIPDQLIGYLSVYRQVVSDLTAPAGSSSLYGETVSANTIRTITSLIAYNVTSTCTAIAVGVDVDGTFYAIQRIGSPAANEPCAFHGHVVLQEGERFRAAFDGVTLNDDIYANAYGFQSTAP